MPDVIKFEKEGIKEQNKDIFIDLQGDIYRFKFYYNQTNDYFSFNMYDADDNSIIVGRKIVYGVNMLNNIADDRLPDLILIPFDKTGEEEKSGITFNNFQEEVLIYVIGSDSND